MPHKDPVLPVKLTMAPVQPKFVVLEQPGPVPNSNINVDDNKLSGINPSDLKERQGLKHHESASATRSALANVQEKQSADQDIKLYKNKTENIDLVKNKTLSQLGVMGEKDSAKRIPKIIYVKSKWHLDVSFEDIGNIMKDTSFLNKLKPLNLNGPMLISTRNKTSNFSLSMPLKMGYCDCWERYCFCCVQLVNERLHLNNKTCANVTFASKSHELGISFTIDSKEVYSGSISANTPPLLCMGSIPSVSDMCLHFFNMTYKVDRHGLHKSQLLGCTDISLNIYNKTISVFPVDCFQIPGDPNHHHKEDNILLPNFVP
ncbi:HisS protein [Elysia marginata]|uniref:HisS protein n=1 Tax=Elysia marginata TaxID=1093978 RepID=A0AAV4J7D7_9GAST|nr:HisS protein [Elysia marginata]